MGTETATWFTTGRNTRKMKSISLSEDVIIFLEEKGKKLISTYQKKFKMIWTTG